LLADEYQLEETTSVEALRNRCAEKEFDLLLIHRSLVDMDTFSEIHTLAPSGRFFLLSDQPNEEEGLAFLKLGIVGYGNTYISQGRLAEAVRVISNGGVWLGQKVMQRLILETYGPEGYAEVNSGNVYRSKRKSRTRFRTKTGWINSQGT
jgi:DNA-binding NarL/FixJ family response regulator